MRRFDFLEPISGYHMIEASAGTGKTYVIENLFARLIEEGLKIEEILVVTFTRAATQELKQRIRDKLPKKVLVDFDKAKIFTIHGFCHRMLKCFMVSDLPDPDSSNTLPLRKKAAIDFLRKLEKEKYTGEDLHAILKQYKFDIDGLVTQLVKLEERKKPIDGKKPFSRLAQECALHIRKTENFSPDDLLHKMLESLEKPEFIQEIRQMFRAVIVDEFQDTDPLQWKIFEKLFLDGKLYAFYLVGDPKQSIYRFRGADVYTYLQAKEKLPSRYFLDTNYRSDPTFIKKLNALFSQCPLALPKQESSLEYTQVDHKPDGIDHSFSDGKDPFCFFKVEDPQATNLVMEEKYLFPFIAQEILYLKEKEGFSLDRIAVLIKDRRQAERLILFLKKYNIPSQSKRGEKISERPYYKALQDLEDLLQHPDLNKLKIVLSGPLFQWDCHRLKEAHTMEPFFGGKTLIEVLQKIEVPDKEALEEFLCDQEEGEEKRSTSGREEVQIMTAHMSKGLEFDIVFALGSAIGHTAKEEYIEWEEQILEYQENDPLCKLHEKETDAEKLRQLYVALTRAKKRVYVPIIHGKTSNESSPIELFCRYVPIENPLDITHTNFQLHSLQLAEPLAQKIPKFISPPPCYISSFTSLAQTQEGESVPIDSTAMPPGKETGVLLHTVLEKIFQVNDRKAWIQQKLEGTRLENWTGEVCEMVEKALRLPLNGFCLLDIPPSDMFSEMEFLYPEQTDLLKGSADLVFVREGSYYLVDWKSNRLADYSQESLEKEMKKHDYFLQAKIYEEALGRYVKLFDIEYKFGGTFYLFIRGGAVYHVRRD